MKQPNILSPKSCQDLVISQVLPPCKPGGLQLYHPIIPSHPQRRVNPTWLAFTGDRWQSLAVQWCCRSTTLHPSMPSRKRQQTLIPTAFLDPQTAEICSQQAPLVHPTKFQRPPFGNKETGIFLRNQKRLQEKLDIKFTCFQKFYQSKKGGKGFLDKGFSWLSNYEVSGVQRKPVLAGKTNQYCTPYFLRMELENDDIQVCSISSSRFFSSDSILLHDYVPFQNGFFWGDMLILGVYMTLPFIEKKNILLKKEMSQSVPKCRWEYVPLPETNIAYENRSSQKVTPLPTIDFHGLLGSGRVILLLGALLGS